MTAALIAACALAGAVSCSDSGPSAEEAKASAAAACARVGEVIDGVDATSLDAIGASRAEVLAATAGGIDELDGLEAPGELQDALDGLVSSLQTVEDDLDQLTRAAAAGDSTAVVGAAADAEPDLDQLDEAAARLGVPECTSESWGRVLVIAAQEAAGAG